MTAIEIMLGRLAPGLFFIHTFLFTLLSASLAALVPWTRHQDWSVLAACRAAPLVRWASTRSYALYLCQGSTVKMMLFHGWFLGSLLRSVAIFFPAAFVLAEVAHRLVERPSMALRPPELRSPALSSPSWVPPVGYIEFSPVPRKVDLR